MSAFANKTDRRLQGSKKRVAILALLVLIVGAGWMSLRLVPLPQALFDPPPPSREFLDRHGQPLRQLRNSEGQFARRTRFEDIPPVLVQATLAAEDKRFWTHQGVDGRATLRAVWGLVRNRRVISGGSTISQQVIKLSRPRARTPATKLMEAVQAMRLEQVWTKERILEEYLNRLDYGNLSIGCAGAALYYLGKPLPDLSAAEAAFLAGLPQAPTRLNPHHYPQRARKRQQWILGRMSGLGWLSDDALERARSESLRVLRPERVFRAPHFVDLLLQQEGAEKAPGDTAPVHTTLDLELNGVVEKILRENLAQLAPRHARNGAAVVLENRSGEVLALVGSEDFFSRTAGQVNGTWARRSAGSALKPFTYLLAFEQGASPATLVADLPVEYATSTGLFAPLNYNRRCYGPLRYRLALGNSLNIPAVKVLASVGGPAVLQKRLQECGLTTLTEGAEFYGLGLTIGNADVRLLELANAYACLARLGVYRPYRLRPMHGPAGAAGDSDPGRRRVCSPAAAYLVADILSDNAARTLTFGPDSDLRFSFPAACKTGTSSDFRDNWAFGFTPEFTVGVWVGNFDGSPMHRVSGVSGAAPVLRRIFEYLHDRHGTSWFAPPTNVVARWVDPLTGKPVSTPRPQAVLEKFVADRLPEPESPDDYDSAGRVRLAPEYREWLASSENWLGDQAVAGERAAPLKLVVPLPGTVYYLDPDLPDQGRRVRLRAEGPVGLAWESDSLTFQEAEGGTYAILSEGEHQLTVRDPRSGERLQTRIVVKSL